jgi:hypothetical protein
VGFFVEILEAITIQFRMDNKLFVGWERKHPENRALTYLPEDWECSESASLSDVVELAGAGFEEEGENCFVDNVATGDRLELREGTFIASWGTGVLQPNEYFLFLSDSSGKRYEIW